MDIHIQVIPNRKHRKGISGADWYFDKDGALQVRVSRMTDERYELCLAIHEAIEAILCRYNGVKVRQVDEFDQQYEKTHRHNHGLDAGDDAGAPYRHEHSLATAAERIMAAELNIVWSEYDKELAAL